MSSSLKSLININGQILEPDKARISVFDRGFLYGDSVYEVTQTIDSVPFLLDDHLDRLFRSAQKIHLHMSHSPEDLKKHLARTLTALQTPRAYIRYIITRGEGEIGLDPALAMSSNLVIITKELPLYPEAWYTQGVHVIVADTLRNPTESIDPNVKSGNYLNNVMAYGEATKRGAFDAIMLNHRGEVTEATTSNVWIVHKGQLITPPLSSGLLEGITRQHLIDLVAKLGLKLQIAPIKVDKLRTAEEIFLTSTTKRLVPITRLDTNTVGQGVPGAVTQMLSQAYDRHVDQLQEQARGPWQAILQASA